MEQSYISLYYCGQAKSKQYTTTSYGTKYTNPYQHANHSRNIQVKPKTLSMMLIEFYHRAVPIPFIARAFRICALSLPPSSPNTAATLLPFASRIAPNLLPAYAPTMRPGTFATMNPMPAPQTPPVQDHQGLWRCTSGRRSYVM